MRIRSKQYTLNTTFFCLDNGVHFRLLLWEAGTAKEKLDAPSKGKGIDTSDSVKWAEFIKNNKDAAFYEGKLYSARYFIKNVLPEVRGYVNAIKSEDMSIIQIAEESFAS